MDGYFVVLTGVLILAGILLALSPGKPRPVVDGNGKPLPNSISEKVFVDINGVKQGMFIKSKDARHPVLLYLHGGMPDYFLTRTTPPVWRTCSPSCGGSSAARASPTAPTSSKTDTIEQLIADTLAMTDYLRERFEQDKIYLMGHSGGTFFGIQAAARSPSVTTPTSAWRRW